MSDVPFSHESERYCIGAAIKWRKAFYELHEIVGCSDAFFHGPHKLIFESLQRLSEKPADWDLLAIIDDVERHGNLASVGGEYGIMQLPGCAAVSVHVERHAGIIREMYERRLLIRFCEDAKRDAMQKGVNVEETIGRLNQKIVTLPRAAGGGFRHIGDVALMAVNRYQDFIDRGVQPAIPTGLYSLDDICGGIGKQELVILGARPSDGKSALMAQIALNTASVHKVAIISVEMPSVAIADRMLLGAAGTTIRDVRQNRLDPLTVKRIFEEQNRLSHLNIWLDDGDGQSPSFEQISSRAISHNAEHGIDLLLIDYLQLIPDNAGEREYERLTRLSRQIKLLARTIDAPIVLLAQLNRDTVKEGSRPRLHHLKGSGAMEQDADQVWLLWRPSEAEVEEDPSLARVRYLAIEKNRNGPTGKIELRWTPEQMQFSDMNDAWS